MIGLVLPSLRHNAAVIINKNAHSPPYCPSPPTIWMDTKVMASSTQDNSPTVLEGTAPKERGDDEKAREETIREVEGGSTPPKDIRFWLMIISLLVATFISALDLTGKRPIICLSQSFQNIDRMFLYPHSHQYRTSYNCACAEIRRFHLDW